MMESMLAQVDGAAAGLDVVTTIISIVASGASAFGAAYLFGKKTGTRAQALEASIAALGQSNAELKTAMVEEQTRSKRIEGTLADLRNRDGSLESAIGSMSESVTQTIAKVEDLAERVHSQEVRLAKLETSLTALPQMGTDIAAVRDLLGALRAEAAHLRGVIESSNGGSPAKAIKGRASR